MLDLNLLFHLCQISSSFQWGERVEEFYERYKEHHERLAATDPYNDTITHEQLTAIAEELERVGAHYRVPHQQPATSGKQNQYIVEFARGAPGINR